MATAEECEQALATLADRLAEKNAAGGPELDRTLSCTISDLDLVFAGKLHNGLLQNIARAQRPDAQIKLTMTGDDLVALVDGRLKMASAWTSGRVKVSAGVRDMLRLRSIF